MAVVFNVVNDGMKLLLDSGIKGYTESETRLWRAKLVLASMSGALWASPTTTWADVSGSLVGAGADLVQATWEFDYDSGATNRKIYANYGDVDTSGDLTDNVHDQVAVPNGSSSSDIQGYAIYEERSSTQTLIALVRYVDGSGDPVTITIAGSASRNVSPVMTLEGCENYWEIDTGLAHLMNLGIRSDQAVASTKAYALAYVGRSDYDFEQSWGLWDYATDSIPDMGDYDSTSYGALAESITANLNTKWTVPAIDGNGRVYTVHTDGHTLENDTGDAVTIYGKILLWYSGTEWLAVVGYPFPTPIVLADGQTLNFKPRITLGGCPA